MAAGLLAGQRMHLLQIDAVAGQFVDHGQGMRAVRKQEIQSSVHGFTSCKQLKIRLIQRIQCLSPYL